MDDFENLSLGISNGGIGTIASMNTAVYITLDEFTGRPEREDEQREELIEGELIVLPLRAGLAGCYCSTAACSTGCT